MGPLACFFLATASAVKQGCRCLPASAFTSALVFSCRHSWDNQEGGNSSWRGSHSAHFAFFILVVSGRASSVSVKWYGARSCTSTPSEIVGKTASSSQMSDHLSRADVGDDDTPALSLRPVQSKAQGPSFQLR